MKTQLLDFEESLKKNQEKVDRLALKASKDSLTAKEKTSYLKEKKALEEKIKKLHKNLTHWQKTQIARHPHRPYTLDYVSRICDHFIELHGDRRFGDDPSLVCGLGKIAGIKVAIVGHQKDRKQPMKRNFGMSNPEGYRKAFRIFKLAEKFRLPIITFIDTPGAYPGIGAEERGQAEAIACNLKEMSALGVPIVCVVIGEGGSGGALGIGVGDQIMMLEHSVYSVIAPESFASIIWRDASKKEEAAFALKNDAKTALSHKLIDNIIPEPIGGAHRNLDEMSTTIKKRILEILKKLQKQNPKKLITQRRKKFSQMGAWNS